MHIYIYIYIYIYIKVIICKRDSNRLTVLFVYFNYLMKQAEIKGEKNSEHYEIF